MNYFWLILKHKWFVFLAGLKITVPLYLLLLHDLSKFSYSEYRHYQRQFFGHADKPENFIRAWVHHQNHNPHHWEYWIPRTSHDKVNYPKNKPIPMPWKYVREMVADWMGASRAYTGVWPKNDDWPWFEKNYKKLRLHMVTRNRIYITLLCLNMKDYADLIMEEY